jgi:hypothetical protein
MPVLEIINIRMFEPLLLDGEIDWQPSLSNTKIHNVPMLFDDVGEPYLVINQYAIDYSKRSSDVAEHKTLKIKMTHLKAYVDFLHEQKVSWLHFPRNQYDNVLFRFRQYLINQREVALIAPSTANARMNAIVNFYRYAQVHKFVDGKLWKEKEVKLSFFTAVGFKRTMSSVTTDLNIRYTPRKDSTSLEGGLMPLNQKDKKTLLNVSINGNLHLYLMLQTGFITAARSETVRTINKTQLFAATVSPDGYYRVRVGPGTGIKTKFSVVGALQIPKQFYDVLCSYAVSDLRAGRSKKAKYTDKDLLFLTVRGNPFAEHTLSKLMFDLRDSLLIQGYSQFSNFHFHQTRATAITERVLIAVDVYGINDYRGVNDVKEFALHKDELTTWKYFKYVEHEPKRQEAGNKFVDSMFGMANILKKLNSSRK